MKTMVMKTGCLVGGLEHCFYDFPYIYNFIIPTDELTFFATFFFRGAAPPPTSNDMKTMVII